MADAATVEAADPHHKAAAVVARKTAAGVAHKMAAGAATMEAARQSAGDRKVRMLAAEAQEATAAMEVSRGHPLVAKDTSQALEMSISFPSTVRLTMMDACRMGGCFQDALQVA